MVRAYISSFSCPHCNTKCSFGGLAVGNGATLYCRGCNGAVFFKWVSREFTDDENTVRISPNLIEDYYPKKIVVVSSAIPEDIADDFREANRCFSVDAKKATVTMCRRVLQNGCIFKGANPNARLESQIDELEVRRIITPSLKEVAHTIRKIGNWGAHPQDDALKDVTMEDASDILKFTSEFLDEVFVRRARLDALRKKKGMK